MMSVNRLLTAMITPFDEKLEVNYAKAAELASYLLANGSDGIVVCGTTGESPVLTMEEKISLFSLVKEKVGEKAKVWAGTGSNSTKASIELSREAEKTGVDGVMIVTPYYNKPSQEGLYQHYKSVAEAISIPIMLYNVPSRTGINMLPETVKKLSTIENIVALKEACGQMDQVSELINILADDFLIYSGDDSLTLPMMAMGAVGIVSIASHIVGLKIKEMISAFISGNVESARRLHSELFPMFKGLFITTNPVPVKEALNLIGMEVGGTRLPLVSANEEQITFLSNLLNEYNIIKK